MNSILVVMNLPAKAAPTFLKHLNLDLLFSKRKCIPAAKETHKFIIKLHNIKLVVTVPQKYISPQHYIHCSDPYVCHRNHYKAYSVGHAPNCFYSDAFFTSCM